MSNNRRFLHHVFFVFAFSGCLAGNLNAGDSDLDEAIRSSHGHAGGQAAPGRKCAWSNCGTSSGSARRWPARCSAAVRATARRPVQEGLPEQLQRRGDRERPEVARHGARRGRWITRPSRRCSSGPTQHQIPLRGHNVFWGVPNMVQPWLKALDDATCARRSRPARVDIARRYRGRFAEYDLNNEMLHGNYYEQRLGTNITRDMAAWMRQEDPQAVLYLNDYDILTGRRVEDYVAQIRKFLDQGVPIGGIGVQGHLHGDSFDPAALQRRSTGWRSSSCPSASPSSISPANAPSTTASAAPACPTRRSRPRQSAGGLLPHLLRASGGARAS